MCDENPLDAIVDLLEENQAERAVIALRAFFDAGHQGLMARRLMGEALFACGNLDEALAWNFETSQLYPDVVEVALATGSVLLALERLPAAIGEFQRALRIDPDNADARLMLAQAWLEAGEAQKVLDQLARMTQDDPSQMRLRAEAERILEETRSDAKYVRHLFDDFSTTYDAHMLDNLHYRAPQALRGLFDFVAMGQTGLSVLDLGCGTGLSGLAFRDIAKTLVGIDLSPRMIAEAEKRGLYDAVCVGDIERLPFAQNGIDLALAADTLVYLGEIAGILRETRRVLKPGALFLFSVERKDEGGFDLGPKRRWRHSETYLREMAARFEYDVVGLLTCSPRTEAGTDVAGFAVALRKRE